MLTQKDNGSQDENTVGCHRVSQSDSDTADGARHPSPATTNASFPMLSFSLFFLCLFSAANPGARAEKPELLPTTTRQLDLVYPRPSKTHRLTYPFPIVCTIHGAKSVWAYHLKTRWSLVDKDNPNRPEVVDGGAFNDSDTYSSPEWTEGDYPNGDDDPLYYIS